MYKVIYKWIVKRPWSNAEPILLGWSQFSPNCDLFATQNSNLESSNWESLNWPLLSSYIISLVLFACGGVWSSFPFICLVIHPSKFLILEGKDDGEGGRRRRMAAATVYPNVYAIQSCSLWKTPVVLQFTKSYELILKN
jgi:hypothetical protein